MNGALARKMKNMNHKPIIIDLDMKMIHVYVPNSDIKFSHDYRTRTRPFYLSIIAFVINQMKEKDILQGIRINDYEEVIKFLNENVSVRAKNFSKDWSNILVKVIKAWGERLKYGFEDKLFNTKFYHFDEDSKEEIYDHDATKTEMEFWNNLIELREIDKVVKLKFAVDEVDLSLNDVAIIFKDKEERAWERFLESIKPSIQVVEVEEQSEAGLSSIKDNLLAFLSDIKNKLELRLKQKSPIYYQNKIDPKKLFIPIQVTIEKFKKHIVENLFEYSESKEDLRRAYAFKKVEEKTYNAIPWEEVTNSNEPIIVLADPGMGKSTLLIMEALSVVQKEELKLKKNHIIEEDLKFPIYLKLNEISKSDEEISKTILNVVKKNYPETSKPILNILKNSLMAGKCLLLFDGLDEVPIKRYYNFLRRFNRFLIDSRCRIIGTSRIVGYSGGFLGNVKEVEIVPFNEAQIREFVNTYFKNIEKFIEDKSISSKGLLQELSDKPQIRGMAQNPLLITIICRLYQEKDIKLPTRRCLLYKKAINYMLSSWSRKSIKQTEARVQSKISLLEEMAYFFSKKKGKEIFSLKELLKFTQKFLTKEKSFTKFYDADSIITELSEDDGILIKLNREGDRYIFFHLTFQEYLTASYLKEVYEDNQSRAFKIVSKFLYVFRWHETITLLVGLLSDPITFIRYITEQEDDIFYSLLILAGKCISECEENNHPLFGKIFKKIYAIFRIYPYERFIYSVLVALSQSNSQLLSWLLELFKIERGYQKKLLAQLLGEIGRPEVIWALLEALSDEDWWIEKTAADSLRKFDGPEIITALIEAFHNKERKMRMYAAVRLGEIGNDRVIESVIRAINDEDWEVRLAALWVLGGIGTQKVIPAIIDTLSDDDSRIRLVATVFLAKIGGSQATKALLGVLQDENTEVRMFAVACLGRIGCHNLTKALIHTLKDDEKGVRIISAISLGAIGSPKAISALIGALQNEEREVRMFVAGALGNACGRNVIERLVETASDRDKEVRTAAVSALRGMDSSYIIPELINRVNDRDWRIRISSTLFFGNIGNSKGISMLIGLLAEEWGGHRGNVERCHEDLRRTDVIQILIKAVNDEYWEVRMIAAKVLGEMGIIKAVPELAEALRDEYDEVRLSSLYALGAIGSTEAIYAMAVALRDEDELIQEAAFDILEEIGSGGVIDVLIEALCDENSEVRERAVSTLGNIGSVKAIDVLIEALNDESWDVVIAAAIALVELGRTEGISALIEVLNDESWDVIIAAATALVELGRNEGMSALIEAINDDCWRVRMSAAKALRELGRTECIKALIEVLNDENWEVRKTAAIAIEEIGSDKSMPVLIEALGSQDLEFKKFAIKALRRIGKLYILKYIIVSAEIDIYDPYIFELARDLAIKFCEKKVGFIPVHPGIVERFKKK